MKQILQKGNETLKRKCCSKQAIRNNNREKRKGGWTFKVMIPTLENRKGRVRSYEDNMMVILALYASLNRHVKSMKYTHHNSI